MTAIIYETNWLYIKDLLNIFFWYKILGFTSKTPDNICCSSTTPKNQIPRWSSSDFVISPSTCYKMLLQGGKGKAWQAKLPDEASIWSLCKSNYMRPGVPRTGERLFPFFPTWQMNSIDKIFPWETWPPSEKDGATYKPLEVLLQTAVLRVPVWKGPSTGQIDQWEADLNEERISTNHRPPLLPLQWPEFSGVEGEGTDFGHVYTGWHWHRSSPGVKSGG